jgi:hypothetical protein
MVDKNVIPAISGFLGLYILYVQPFKVAFFTLLLAAVVLSLTNSFEYTLTVLAFSALIGGFNQFLDGAAGLRGGPVGVEGFQSKDPVSVQTRLEEVRQPAPLAPKVEAVTGVLESPSILDNVPLQPMQQLMSDAAPGKSIPASAKARVMIYPVPEGFVPNQGIQDVPPMENPYLQNGPDDDGLETAMIGDGTEMPTAKRRADEQEGVETGSAPAFR